MANGDTVEQITKKLGEISENIQKDPLNNPFEKKDDRNILQKGWDNVVGLFGGGIKNVQDFTANLVQNAQQAQEALPMLTNKENQEAWRRLPSPEETKLLAEYKKQKSFQDLQSNSTLQTLATGMNLANMPAGNAPEGAGLDRIAIILHENTHDLLDQGGQLKAAFNHVMKKVGEAWQKGGNFMEKIQGAFTALTSSVQGFFNGDSKHDLLKERVENIYDDLREKGFSKDFSTKIAEGAYKTGAEKAGVPADKLLDIKQVVDKPNQATNILAAATGGEIKKNPVNTGALSTLQNENLSTPKDVNPLASLMNLIPPIPGVTSSPASAPSTVAESPNANPPIPASQAARK